MEVTQCGTTWVLVSSIEQKFGSKYKTQLLSSFKFQPSHHRVLQLLPARLFVHPVVF